MLKVKNAIVPVRNVDNDCSKWIVARLVDGELWYWGSWDDEEKEKAEKAARDIKGIVLEKEYTGVKDFMLRRRVE